MPSPQIKRLIGINITTTVLGYLAWALWRGEGIRPSITHQPEGSGTCLFLLIQCFLITGTLFLRRSKVEEPINGSTRLWMITSGVLATLGASFSGRVWSQDLDFGLRLAVYSGSWLYTVLLLLSLRLIPNSRLPRSLQALLSVNRAQVVVTLMMSLLFIRQDLIFTGAGFHHTSTAAAFGLGALLLAKSSVSQWHGRELDWAHKMAQYSLSPLALGAVLEGGSWNYFTNAIWSLQGVADLVCSVFLAGALFLDGATALLLFALLPMSSLIVVWAARMATLSLVFWLFVESGTWYFLTPFNFGSSLVVISVALSQFYSKSQSHQLLGRKPSR